MARRSPARSNRRSLTHPVHQPPPRRAGDQMVDDHHHRDVQGGAARAAVFGVSDGLVSNVSLILGVAGAVATTNPGFVRLAGMAGLVAGAFSMAAGEYVSMRAQTELLERQIELEAAELAVTPGEEREELSMIYRAKGFRKDHADELADHLIEDKEVALDSLIREEL